LNPNLLPYSEDAVKRDGNIIIIDLKPKSRVVSFKAREDLVRRFDALITIHNLGSRSRVLKKLMEALTNLLENMGNGVIKDLSISVKYYDGNREKTLKVSIRP